MATSIAERIRNSGLTIYDPVPTRLFVGNKRLESILNRDLQGKCLDYPLRTRSKIVKALICDALGYPVPRQFKKSQPRFPGQNFDTYVQKSNNFQVWNEELSASRRYVLVRVNDESRITKVKVLSGEALSRFDTTGTLTQKFQAKSRAPVVQSQLVSPVDTNTVAEVLTSGKLLSDFPRFLPIAPLYEKLKSLVGTSIPRLGNDQERNRGASLHRTACKCLAQEDFRDTGQFPDIPNQLLEIKLQTSPTIDLGLVTPDSTAPISDMPIFRHCDVRYAVFYGSPTSSQVQLNAVVVTTGEHFFDVFRRFAGKVLNRKLQIPLPRSFFD